MAFSFSFDSMLDVAVLRSRFRQGGRLRIEQVLADEGASDLLKYLDASDRWHQVINGTSRVFELSRAARTELSAAQAAALDDAVFEGASAGFQYRYEAIRVSDRRSERSDGDPLTAFARWMGSAEALDTLRAITGMNDVCFADAQATAYSAGDLLTAHTDEVEGKSRRAAYVLGLTRRWRPEWGGLLLFHGANGAIEGVSPSFNTLDIFSVPQPHSVSCVTRSAPHPRFSITGWLRADTQPD